MYEAHPVFHQPENELIRVWRYLDFTKFVSLLESESLYFTRADKFDDPFEGSWPRMNLIEREASWAQIAEIGKERRQAFINLQQDQNKNWPKFHALNCWHMNDHESAAMWRLYLKSDEGVAIQTTYKRLRESFTGEENIYLGTVQYIDYENEWINTTGNIFSPFMYKRKSFEHEREARALIAKWPPFKSEISTAIKSPFQFEQETMAHGVEIKVNIQLLIERVYIAPSAPSWFSALVDSVVKRYGHSLPVTQSKLNEKPLY